MTIQTITTEAALTEFMNRGACLIENPGAEGWVVQVGPLFQGGETARVDAAVAAACASQWRKVKTMTGEYFTSL